MRKASDTEFLDDWYRVSVSQLHRIGGTTMIQNNRGLASVLERIYPSHHWAQVLFLRGTKILMEQEKFYSVAKKVFSTLFEAHFKGVISKVGSDSSSLSFIDLVF